MKTAKLKVVGLFFAIFLCFSPLAYGNDIPRLINYEGTLSKDGESVPDGSYDVEFNIYNAEAGGTPIWTEVWNGTKGVEVRNGIFSVQLGTHTPIPSDFFTEHPETYLGIKVGTDSEMQPRQQITSVAYAFTAGTGGIPKGGIIMWSGSVDAIPAGWTLCDGTDETPDLRDRFIVGAGGNYAVDAKGGTEKNDLTHAHSIAPENRMGTTSAGGHSHSVNINTGDVLKIGDNYYKNCKRGDDKRPASKYHQHNVSGNTSGVGNHSHVVNAHKHGGFTGIEFQSTPVENRPPFYALCFIMKL